MPLRPEQTYRRKHFDADRSEPVTLSDGQVWHLPKPWLAIRTDFERGKPRGHTRYFTQGPELDELIEAIGEAETLADQVVAGMALAALMLLRNYDLADDELAEVLVYYPGSPDSQAMLKAIVEVATGRSGKKHSPAGADSV